MRVSFESKYSMFTIIKASNVLLFLYYLTLLLNYRGILIFFKSSASFSL